MADGYGEFNRRERLRAWAGLHPRLSPVETREVLFIYFEMFYLSIFAPEVFFRKVLCKLLCSARKTQETREKSIPAMRALGLAARDSSIEESAPRGPMGPLY